MNRSERLKDAIVYYGTKEYFRKELCNKLINAVRYEVTEEVIDAINKEISIIEKRLKETDDKEKVCFLSGCKFELKVILNYFKNKLKKLKEEIING